MIDGPLLGQEIEAALASWDGEQLSPFAMSFGNGIAMSLSGILQYTTQDLGSVAGNGAGTGTGISGMSQPNIATGIYDKGQSLWSAKQRDGPGTEWMGFCNKISTAFIAHVKANAKLNSVHTPVFAGNGQVVKYFGVTPEAMQAMIVQQAPADWAKAMFPDLALAVSTGICMELTTHSPKDYVSIVGSPNGSPSPGGGVGNGFVV